MTSNARRRTGFTLVELLVAIAIMVTLMALAIMLLPPIANQDAVLKGADEVKTTLKIGQGLAQGAQRPRGVRFFPNPNGNGYLVTEMQFLEAPPILVPEPEVLVAKPTDPMGTNTPNGPRVEFLYELYDGNTAPDPGSLWSGPPANPPRGTIRRRHCYIFGLDADQQAQVGDGAVLSLPVLGAWSRIIGAPVPSGPALEVVLDVYPDAALGAATAYRTYHFGIHGAPIPLLGEATIPLPKDIAVDLEIGSPRSPAPGRSFDVMFAPNGQLIGTSSVAAGTSVFVWVRDYTKVADMRPNSTSPLVYDYNKFLRGGEQQIVGIRNGFVGTAPVTWPDPAGTYAPNTSPFTDALKKLQ